MMAGQEDPARTVGEVKAADRLSGGLKACSASQFVAEKANKEENAVGASKRKAEDSEAADAANASVGAAAGDGDLEDELQREIDEVLAQLKEEYGRDHPDDSDNESEEEELEAMISRKRKATDAYVEAASHSSDGVESAADAKRYAGSGDVDDEHQKNGRVFVISEAASEDELQKEINAVWAQFMEDYGRIHPDDLGIAL